MNLGGLVPVSLLDYPEKISAVIFTTGCNFKCPWCHNGMLVKEQRHYDETDFFEFLNRRKFILDGVVVSGGEPTIQPDLIPFLTRIKAMNFQIKLDTNGSQPDVIQQCLEKKLIDYIAIDVKAHPALYKSVAGCSISEVTLERSLNLARTIPHQWRLTLVPGLHSLDQMEDYVHFLKDGPLYLQGFRPHEQILSPKFQNLAPYTTTELEQFRNKLSKLMPESLVILR